MRSIRLFFVLFLAAFLAFFSTVVLFRCKQDPEYSRRFYHQDDQKGIKTGGVRRVKIAGGHEVWTKKIGNNPKIKLLLLNGGPGCTSEYFESFESFLPAEGIEFIYYDQLFCGNSDKPADTSLFDLGRFVEETEAVRLAFGLDSTNFFLLGHSWGGIVAMEYALKYQKNLRGLVISNMMSSAPEYGKYAAEVLGPQMPPDVLAEIRAIEARKDFSNPRYMGLLEPHFYEKHILRLPKKDWPDAVNRSFSKINSALYVAMQGPSEFGISGKLTRWDVSKQLSKIEKPTLTIGAAHDTMDPRHMEWMSKQVKNGQFLLCPNGSHMAMWDDQEAYFSGLVGWLEKVGGR